MTTSDDFETIEDAKRARSERVRRLQETQAQLTTLRARALGAYGASEKAALHRERDRLTAQLPRLTDEVHRASEWITAYHRNAAVPERTLVSELMEVIDELQEGGAVLTEEQSAVCDRAMAAILMWESQFASYPKGIALPSRPMGIARQSIPSPRVPWARRSYHGDGRNLATIGEALRAKAAR